MSAKDDLVIEKVNHGSWNDVFVANNNTASGILASVGVDGVNNFDIQSIDRIRNRPFFPQPFDIPIPAGQRVYVGRDHFKHYLRINRGGTETADVISVATSIVGAQYTTDTRERLPPPEEAENALFLYTAEQVGAGSNRVFFVVNINHEFGLEFNIRTTHGPKVPVSVSQSLIPFSQTYIYLGPPQTRWTFQRAKFFVMNPAVIGHQSEVLMLKRP